VIHICQLYHTLQYRQISVSYEPGIVPLRSKLKDQSCYRRN
ncbi:hypothetical protein VN97_g13215, partial [Penicillium thymicola]